MAEGENIPVHEIKYSDLLAYMKSLIRKGNKKRTVNHIMGALTHLYESLKQRGMVKTNPAETLRIKNVIRRIPHELFSEKELNNIYENFPEERLQDKRNKIISGLIIYQGLTPRSLEALEEKHINLEKGKIYVPQTGRNNERIIELKVFQLIKMHNYINEVRPELLKISKKESDKLFITLGRSSELNNCLIDLRKTLKRISPKFKYLKQIRASLITNLLKTGNVREIQYFAGHRYASSTERYLINNIEDLKKQTEKFHPLN